MGHLTHKNEPHDQCTGFSAAHIFEARSCRGGRASSIQKERSMFRSLVAKVMWVGRATVFMVGLSVMLALLFGIATTALAGNGRGGIFNLGQKNTVNHLTQLVGAPTSGAMLRVDNDGSGTALELKVGLPTANPADKTTPPLTLDSQAKVTNLNAD